jgi:hypothetical protein
MDKTIRFGDLVRNSGRPEVVALWTDPKRDWQFSKAVRENRVVTVIQQPTSKRKDYGKIGFDQQAFASYLVFPRPLPAANHARVIGINYELIEESTALDPVKDGVARSKAKPAQHKPAVPPLPKQKTFSVVVRRTARVELAFTIRASSKSAARIEALKTAKHQFFDLSKAVFHEELVSID